MKKDAYYFPHFCNARSDRKIKRVLKDLGIEGYAIYFMLLEVLREQTDFKYPVKDIDLLADEFGTTFAKVKVVVENYQLFEIDGNLMFFSSKLVLYLQPYIEKSKRARAAALKRWNEVKKTDAFALPEHCVSESKCNANQNASKVKESKVKESKENAVVDLKIDLCETKKTTPLLPEKTYQENIGLLTQHIAERIKALVDDGVSEELLSKYIQVSVERNKKTWSYIEKMAIGNLDKNIKTLEQYNASQLEREKTKAKQIITNLNIPQHVNFDQREPEDDYEKYYYKVEEPKS